MKANTLPLHRKLTHLEAQILRAFSNQFDEFWSNFQELQKSGLDMSISLRMERGRVYGNNLSISRHRIKGFLADYRLFHHQNPQQAWIAKVVEILESACPEPALIAVLTRNLDDWASPNVPIAGWHNTFSVSDIIETLFNTRIFHLDERPRYSDKTKQDLALAFDDNAIWWSALLVAYNRLLCVRNINWIAEPLTRGQEAVQIPA